MEDKLSIDQLIAENKELKNKLFETQNLLDAIKSGAIDALVVNANGHPTIYSLETADYTYRLLIEKCGEGALSISESGIILYCNEYFSKIIGIPADKLLGTFFISYIDSIGKFTDLKANLNSGVSKGEIELNVNGKKIPVYLSLTNLQPNLPAIGIIVTDLSEKRKHEEDIVAYQRELEIKVEELNQTNIKLEQFIHVISQNINEPVRRILNYSATLMSDEVLKENENLTSINSSAKRLNAFVVDLIKNSIDSNINKKEIELNLLINEVKEDMELIIKENAASLIIGPLPKIQGFTFQLRQLFFNCIISVLKTGLTNPVIEISYEVTNCVDPRFPNKNFYSICVKGKETGATKSQKESPKYFPLGITSWTDSIEYTICKNIMEHHSGYIKQSFEETEKKYDLFFPV